MWQRYQLTLCVSFALCGVACGELREIVARERQAEGGNEAGGGNGGSGGQGDGGVGGAGLGGSEPGVRRPRFHAPIALTELNDPAAKDQDPTLTEDQLEIFFFSDRGGNADLWTATRADADASWNAPVPVEELNSPETEQNPSISRDGLRIWFYSGREPLGIYYAERSRRGAAFTAPELIPITLDVDDPEGFIIAPHLDAAELRMALSFGRGSSRDLYELVRPSLTGSWGAPTPLSGVNSAASESTPFLVDDGRELLFHSGRSGAGDLFWAYRESPGFTFIHIEPLSEINDPASFESHPYLTVDRSRLYFGSDRSGNTDIFMAEAVRR